VGRDRRHASRAFLKVVQESEDADYRPEPDIAFAEWADRWLGSLERKPSTINSYRSTVSYAKQIFGGTQVRRLGPEDVLRFNNVLPELGCSSSTRAKHLRVLSACLGTAVRYRYAAFNPVGALHPGQKPRSERKEAAYFENAELPRLFSELRAEPYRSICLVALKTGMRMGEIFALRWADVDLEEAVVRVRRSYTGGQVGTPKNRERRDVDLLSELLREQRGKARGAVSLETPIFPGENGSTFLCGTTLLRRELYPAMKRAGVPRVGPTHERRTFHSFRHTFAKRALESGAQITWLSRHLGHSTMKVTTDIYGHWERAERKLQAAKMEGVFPV
jgi:integrase